MHPFRAFISAYTPLSDAEWQAIEACITRREVPPGTLLLEAGQVCRSLYFLEQGLLRFFVWKDGEEVTKFFTEAPYTLTAQQSFTSELPARENIETLEACVLWDMPHADAFALLRIGAWSTFIRKLIQEVQGLLEALLEDFQTRTAEERYRDLLDHEPELLLRVPLRHLASYLGIAPQSLSRIRRQMLPHRS